MDNEYIKTKTTSSLINYHFVFCPRYRRKIFLDSSVEKRFKELVYEACKEIGVKVLAIDCDKDHTHMFLRSLPQLSPSEIMGKIKGRTSRYLRLEFEFLSRQVSLWTRSFFVSTAGKVSSSTIRNYIESQKKRG